ncbi:MAG: hypothetical protein R3250_00135 [Melioribacteraceae bacterium]|nr:hypothetical protein [Melioribacteraceae bacterium]
MNIEEAKQLKHEIESEILKKLYDFEAKTETKVKEIKIVNDEVINSNRIFKVEISAELL